MGKGSRGKVKATSVIEGKISFSFRYLKTGPNNKFCHKQKSSAYFCKVIDRLKHICGWTPLQLKTNRNPALKCNPIKWKEPNITEPCFDLINEEDLVGGEAYEFGVSRNEHGRIHGFFRDTIFHIVWLDPDHKLFRDSN